MPAPRPTPAPTDRAALEVAILASELGVARERDRRPADGPPAPAPTTDPASRTTSRTRPTR